MISKNPQGDIVMSSGNYDFEGVKIGYITDDLAKYSAFDVYQHNKQKINLHMHMAMMVSEETYCKRKQVGVVIVTLDNGITYGYNGTPSGEENVCEFEDGTTSPYVYHAEFNAIAKLHDNRMDARGGTLFTTLSPCIECAKLIERWGIDRVYFLDQYKNVDGLNFLARRDVDVFKVKIVNSELFDPATLKHEGKIEYGVDFRWEAPKE